MFQRVHMLLELHARARRGARAVAFAGGLALVMAGALVPLAGFANAPATTSCGATDTQCVITFGNTAIAARQTALSKLNGRVTEVNSDGRISSADNAALVGDIATNESGLTTLKGQLDSATDAKTARDDVKLIYTQFRIFAVVLPRDYHQLWLDMIIHTDTPARWLRDDHPGRDQRRARECAGPGEPRSSPIYKSQVSTAQAQTQAAQPIYAQLTPAAFDANATAYAQTYRQLQDRHPDGAHGHQAGHLRPASDCHAAQVR